MTTGAGDVWFYHLERSSLDLVLPELLERTLARDWRALVRVGDPAALAALDDRLWTWRAESFLPHGRADREDAERQPILLTVEGENRNGAQVQFVVEGAPLEDLGGYERCLVLFDGRDDQAVAEARELWKRVKAQGASASYWKQGEDGGWSKAG